MRVLTASVCILFASALAGAKAQLQKLLKTISFCGGICVCAICARSATILQTERKSNKITAKSHTKSTLPRKLKTTSKKCRFEHQNASQNRPRHPRPAQERPRAAGRPKKTPPEARIRGPPRPTSTRKSCSKILVKRSFETALRKIHETP